MSLIVVEHGRGEHAPSRSERFEQAKQKKEKPWVRD
jgi:hypothetical protein